VYTFYLGISILFSKPEGPQTNLFSFTQPLSFQVWIFTATAYLGLSLILFFLARYINRPDFMTPRLRDPVPKAFFTQKHTTEKVLLPRRIKNNIFLLFAIEIWQNVTGRI